MVALEAKGTDPDLGGIIDGREWIKHGAASTATERRVRENGHTGEGLDRGVDGRDRDHTVAGLLFGSRKHVPRHPHSILCF